MEKTLTQAEIDLLFQAAQGARPSKPTPADKRIVTRCDFLQSGRLSKEQAQAVTMLHEGFAPRLSNSLGAYLREGFEARLVSVEQLSYSDFLSRISEMTFFCTIPVKPMDSQAGVQIDMPLVFPMIDLLLGGSGKGQPERQDLTEIEEQIMQSVVAIICRELREAWNSVMAVEFFAGTALKRSQIRTLMASGEKVLTLSFEIVLGETRGMLNLVFPPLAANLLLRKLAQMGATSRSRTSGESTGRLRARLLGCEFPAELLLDASQVWACVAFQDDEPAACASLWLASGEDSEVGFIGWVGALPQARGRGLAAACTVAATNRGFELGATVASLQASPMGEPIYRRLGYEELYAYRLLGASPPAS